MLLFDSSAFSSFLFIPRSPPLLSRIFWNIKDIDHLPFHFVFFFHTSDYRLHQELDPSDTTFQLACQAGLTGYIDIVVYAKSNVWSGYITGTMVQFAQNM